MVEVIQVTQDKVVLEAEKVLQTIIDGVMEPNLINQAIQEITDLEITAQGYLQSNGAAEVAAVGQLVTMQRNQGGKGGREHTLLMVLLQFTTQVAVADVQIQTQ